MRLCTFEVRTHLGRARRVGVETARGIVDVNFSYARLTGSQKLADVLAPADMLSFLQAGAAHRAAECLNIEGRGLNDETLVYTPDEVRIMTPLPRPASVRDFFAFEAHVKKGFEKRGEPMPAEWYEIPVYYKSGHHNILGPDDDVLWPKFTERFDYELELAAVIGREGRNIRAADARQYIAGFTVMNDFSARDIQRREMKVRLWPAKGKDWATAMGPVLVTPDEIDDPYSLEMTARVNGEEWSRGNSRTMFHTFERMIEFVSEDDTLFPGDVIGSGTVGTGCGLELDRWVKPGDVIELEIERIGVLRNRVVRPDQRGGGNE
jgi:2-keto-4-pentenoate hydratase/2-oxohepta-3-ene-1,7-dioic acid hydratase in catechol pathway